MNRRLYLHTLSASLAGAAATWAVGAQANARPSHDALFWRYAREGGNVMLMRHAQTVSGVGDPLGFTLDDCSTQRNLSVSGRAFAPALGRAFASQGVRLDAVRSSAWCRCQDTARLAFEPHQPHYPSHDVWPALNSFFQGQGNKERQTAEVFERIREQPEGHNWMLVTHQVNIAALTGQGTRMGEVLLCRMPDRSHPRLTVLASLAP